MSNSVIHPPRLQPGDRVAVVSPSGTVAEQVAAVDGARRALEVALDLQLRYSPHALGTHFYSSGTAQERSDDLAAAFADPETKAIFLSIGGATAIDLVDRIDYREITNNPKIVAGISDSSTILNSITAVTGLVTFHGFEMLDFARYPMSYTAESMRRVLFDGWFGGYSPNSDWRDLDAEVTTYRGWRAIKPGIAEGSLVGGNSEALMQILGTEFGPSLDGKLLLLETYRFQKRHIHAALTQLRIRGVFGAISGLVLGYCLGSDSPGTGNERDLSEIVAEVTDGFGFPVVQVGEIGHQVENLIMPLGASVRISTDPVALHLLEPAVS